VSIHDEIDRKEADMAREVCFCGWVGEIADREPVYAGDGDWGLSCPTCGHLDRLEDWSEAGRRRILAEAARRRGSRLEALPVARARLAA
jgi:hypothetical protein